MNPKNIPGGRTCHLILVLCSMLLAGCGGGPTQFYHHPTFGYTVEMPKDWIVDEDPWMSSRQGEENTVLFHRPRSNPPITADRDDSVKVNVVDGKEPYDVMRGLRLGLSNADAKVREWNVGDTQGYYVESRFLPFSGGWSDWSVTYYVSHKPNLYIIRYGNNEDLQKEVNVFIGAYEQVNIPR